MSKSLVAVGKKAQLVLFVVVLIWGDVMPCVRWAADASAASCSSGVVLCSATAVVLWLSVAR